MKLCDLHTHSVFSDGSLSPAQLVAQAECAGLSAVALCDHNTVAGLQSFMEAGKGSLVETVPGIEFSTGYFGKELHLIMLFVQPEHYTDIIRQTDRFREQKKESMRLLVQALQKSGVRLDLEELVAGVPDGYINRAHVASELVRQGYVASVQEAFRKYLKPCHGYYTPPQLPDVFEMIAFIRDLGGISVLAHPFLNLNVAELEEFLPQAKAAGLDAMETIYARYNAETTQRAKETAAKFRLLESGGSDFHGEAKPDVALGSGTGDLKISLAILEQLKLQKMHKK